jgi:branched-chain amino acid transport system substrate-binding protein
VSFRPKPLGARAAIISSAGATAADDLKGALIYRPTCPLQAYAKNRPKPVFTRVLGRGRSTGARSSSSPRTTQPNSDLAKSALAEVYEDEGADIAIGTNSSARQLRCCPWPGRKKMLIVEPAVADKVTGPKHRAIHPRMTPWPPAKRR